LEKSLFTQLIVLPRSPRPSIQAPQSVNERISQSIKTKQRSVTWRTRQKLVRCARTETAYTCQCQLFLRNLQHKWSGIRIRFPD